MLSDQNVTAWTLVVNHYVWGAGMAALDSFSLSAYYNPDDHECDYHDRLQLAALHPESMMKPSMIVV
jgi:hypothetical protein